MMTMDDKFAVISLGWGVQSFTLAAMCALGELPMVDAAIRKVRPPYDLFLHPSRKPLETVDFRTLEEMGQIRLWDDECSGLCGV